MNELFLPVINEKFTALDTGNHDHAKILGEIQSHVRDAGPGDDGRNFQQGRFHDNLRSETAGAVKNFPSTGDPVKPHFASDGVGCVVAADIFYEYLHLFGAAQRAAMHCSGGFVYFVIGGE